MTDKKNDMGKLCIDKVRGESEETRSATDADKAWALFGAAAEAYLWKRAEESGIKPDPRWKGRSTMPEVVELDVGAAACFKDPEAPLIKALKDNEELQRRLAEYIAAHHRKEARSNAGGSTILEDLELQGM